jgi:hypothetical protein
VKKRGDTRDIHPEAVFAFNEVGHQAQTESLFRLGTSVGTRKRRNLQDRKGALAQEAPGSPTPCRRRYADRGMSGNQGIGS